MGAMASQITSLTIVYSIVYSDADQRKTSKVRVTGLCAGNSPGTDEFPAQMASNAENVSIWWRHYDRKNFDIRQWSKIAFSTELVWPFIGPLSSWILIIFHHYGASE